MQPSIVFDFDGTLALGHGPVRAYAQQLAPLMEDGFIDAVESELATYDTGESTYRDGYDIVGSMAQAAGITSEQLSAAYLASRNELGTGAADVDTMPDLAGFLNGLRGNARLVFATNAPDTGIAALFERWGVTGLFDEVHFNLGKPAGLEGLVDRLIAEGPVLSIGDIAINDLIPAAARGADTALVGAMHRSAPIPVTMQAASLADLRTTIETWAAQRPAHTPAASGAETPIER